MAAVRVRDLKRRFHMGCSFINALDGIDLDISSGEFCAIMGPSGSGKSTLMNVIGFLDTPDAGEYWFDGDLVRDLSQRRLAQIRNQSVGFVFQTFNLLANMTALQNVEVPLIYAGLRRKECQVKAREALGIVGLTDRIWHKPAELSGGQCQRVAIARAIVTKPGILLADEPTGNLDSVTAGEIMQLFESLHAAGMTIVLVTHDSAVAEHAERIVGMLDGRIVADSIMDSE